MNKFLEEYKSKKLLATVLGGATLASAGQWELFTAVVLGFIGVKGAQNVAGIIKKPKEEKNWDNLVPAAITKYHGAHGPSILPLGDFMAELEADNPTNIKTTKQQAEAEPNPSHSVFNRVPEPPPEVHGFKRIDIEKMWSDIVDDVSKMNDVVNKKWKAYIILAHEIGANVTDDLDYGYAVGWDYYGDMPTYERVEDALNITRFVVVAAQDAYEEITGLNPHIAATKETTYQHTMWVQTQLPCGTPSDDRYNAAWGQLRTAWEHLDALQQMNIKGVNWELVPKQSNNPWGLGNYAYIKQ